MTVMNRTAMNMYTDAQSAPACSSARFQAAYEILMDTAMTAVSILLVTVLSIRSLIIRSLVVRIMEPIPAKP